jgi:hypothetical protein
MANQVEYQAPPHSVSVQGAYEPFDLQVARGQIMGHSTVNIYGFQAAVGVTPIPVWENATGYTYPVAAITMNLASSVNTGEDLSGTTILIQGLGAGYVLQSETLALTGTTDVVTTKSYLRINSMAVASGAPTGAITLKDSTNTTTYARITALFGRTQMSIYTVPAGYTFYLSRINAYTSANGNGTDFILYRNQQISPAGVTTYTQQAPFTQEYSSQRVMPRPFVEKTDIQLQAKSSSGTYNVAISAEGYLIKNDSQQP